MKDKIKEYLHFGKSERNAIALLIVVMIAAFLVPAYVNSLRKPEKTDFEGFTAEIDEFLKKSEQAAPADQGDFDFTRPDKYIAVNRIKPFLFDPNVLDKKGWVKLGFTEKQAAGILKFREKGGTFRTKEDVKKLYVVDAEIYSLLEPYIQLPEKTEQPAKAEAGKSEKPVSRKSESYRVELNGADSASLVKVRGIGPAFARRIIRYRDKLGGFSDIGQLQDVYGMDSARFNLIEEYLYTNADLIKKINVNSASLDELRSHPFIDYYIAKAIVDKRIQKGAFDDLNELKEIPLIHESLFLKLSPYLTVNNSR